MTERYINIDTGNDSNVGSLASPWKTIPGVLEKDFSADTDWTIYVAKSSTAYTSTGAIYLNSNHNGKNISFIATGTTGTVTFGRTGSAGGVVATNTISAAASLSFTGFTFLLNNGTDANGNGVAFFSLAAKDVALGLVNCNSTTTVTYGYQAIVKSTALANATRSLTITGCTFYNKAIFLAVVDVPVISVTNTTFNGTVASDPVHKITTTLTDSVSVSINGVTVLGATNSFARFYGVTGKSSGIITIRNNLFVTSTTCYFVCAGGTKATSTVDPVDTDACHGAKFYIDNNVSRQVDASNGIQICFNNWAYIHNNILEFTGACSGYGIELGVQSISQYASQWPMDAGSRVINNTILGSSTIGGFHGIIINPGAEGCEVAGNKIHFTTEVETDSFDIVVKAPNALIHHNLVRGCHGLILAANNTGTIAVFNTFLSDSGSPLRIMGNNINNVHYAPARCTVTDNIFAASLANTATYLLNDESGDKIGDNFFDNNIYYQGNCVNFGYLYELIATNLSEYVANWSEAPGNVLYINDNDLHSVDSDPRIIDTAIGSWAGNVFTPNPNFLSIGQGAAAQTKTRHWNPIGASGTRNKKPVYLLNV